MPGTRQRTTHTRSKLRLPRAVSGKVAQPATPVTPQAFTRQRMKCAPPRDHTSRISSREQRLHSGPCRNSACIRSVEHPCDPSRRIRALRRVLQDLEEPAPCGRIKPIDPVRFSRRKLGDNTLEVPKPNKLRPALTKTLREYKLITRLPPQLGCPGRKICPQQRQQGTVQTKHSAVRKWCVSERRASQTKSVAFEGAEKIARPRSSLGP